MDKEETKTPSLKRIIAQINKEHGENILGFVSNMPDLEIKRLSTGIKSLDKALGGGLPQGRVVELYGMPSAGKNLISLLTIAEAQKQGLECVYLDAEDSFDPIWTKKLGVDIDKLILGQSSVGEDTLELVLKLLKGNPAIIVVDSIAALVTRAELTEDIDKAFMAPKARLLGRALRMILAQNQNTTIIFLNQLRSTMALYGPLWTVPGGQAVKYASSVRIEVKKTEDIHLEDKKSKEIIGQVISFKVTKNKTATPFQVGSCKFLFEGGIQQK